MKGSLLWSSDRDITNLWMLQLRHWYPCKKSVNQYWQYHIVETAESTVEEQAEQIATAIQKYYKPYDYLSVENKARLFNFRIDDNSYNLQLHAGVLRKLGIHMYGGDIFEDYQSIYGETMKKAEKQKSEYECGYDDKKWERGRGRWPASVYR